MIKLKNLCIYVLVLGCLSSFSILAAKKSEPSESPCFLNLALALGDPYFSLEEGMTGASTPSRIPASEVSARGARAASGNPRTPATYVCFNETDFNDEEEVYSGAGGGGGAVSASGAATAAATAAATPCLSGQEQTGLRGILRCSLVSQKKSTKKRISFAEAAKTHDGLSPESQILDSLFYAYFETQCISNKEDIHRVIVESFSFISEGFDLLVTLEKVRENLKIRSETLSDLDEYSSIPVLAVGGGRGLQLQAVHGPHVNRLIKLFDRFSDSEELMRDAVAENFSHRALKEAIRELAKESAAL